NQDKLAAYVRLVPRQTKFKEVSIGRVLVVKEFRGKGYAKAIMEKAINHLINEWGENVIKIQAQHYLYNFYSSLGFEQITDIYLDDVLPHLDMILLNNDVYYVNFVLYILFLDSFNDIFYFPSCFLTFCLFFTITKCS